MNDLSTIPTPTAIDLENEFDGLSTKIDQAYHLLGVLDETVCNSLLVHLELITRPQRDGAEQVSALIEAARLFAGAARDNLEANSRAYRELFERTPSAVARHVALARAKVHPVTAAKRRKWALVLQGYRAADSAWTVAPFEDAADARTCAIDTLIGTAAPDLQAVLLKLQLLDGSGEQMRIANSKAIEADLEQLVSLQARGFEVVDATQSREFRDAVTLLDNANGSDRVDDEAFDAAGAAFQGLLNTRVTSPAEFREKLDIIESEGGWTTHGLIDAIFADMDALGITSAAQAEG